MTKDEIIENIKNATENMCWKDEAYAFLKGYLKALRDCYEIDYDTSIDIEFELKEYWDD